MDGTCEITDYPKPNLSFSQRLLATNIEAKMDNQRVPVSAPTSALQPWRERLIAANVYMRHDYAWYKLLFRIPLPHEMVKTNTNHTL